MEQYISKAAVVAEIEKEKKEYAIAFSNMAFKSHEEWLIEKGKYRKLLDILSFLDTLEVKEVDLEKEYSEFLQREWFGKNCNRTMSEMMAFTAKHFYELGLKTQKGE